ncbi:MAG: hypothetical protein M1828_006518 [Chrysothrix sp. TS-e1954]|nr:MAG: hypothetical protein M1828_006518 [Chrysothrix sp. TS-e1954]
MPLITEKEGDETLAIVAAAQSKVQGVNQSRQPANIKVAMSTGAWQSRAALDGASASKAGPPAQQARLAARSHSAQDFLDPSFRKPSVPAKKALEGAALSDTPASTAPTSPIIPPRRTDSGDRGIRARPTTLDIPGLTKSRVSPDGKIPSRDVGSKLVIVMVGLPARGKSYITKKMARYLNWLQHDTKIFNVGERRRVGAGGHGHSSSGTSTSMQSALASARATLDDSPSKSNDHKIDTLHGPQLAAQMLINGNGAHEYPSPQVTGNMGNGSAPQGLPILQLPDSAGAADILDADANGAEGESMDQSANFFDPTNRKAALFREQCAMETLNDLLDYILNQGGSVGVFDATNSTLERRKLIIKHIREAAPDLNVLFMESLCEDSTLLERNMRLKLSGPDYRDKDPETSLIDFKKRVELYKKSYVPLGEYEERNHMPYVQMIDVGRKVISHQIRGFLSAQAVYFLLNFNLAPRQIWITRHGQSVDNVLGRIGGDSELSPYGRRFAATLMKFIRQERKAWAIKESEREERSHLPPQAGDHTPPNPHYEHGDQLDHKSFCVWSSMLKRSVQTAEMFDEEEFDLKQMRMLDELFSGTMEGMTYAEIMDRYPEEYKRRRADKLHYRYPGGGEGYLDVLNRVRPVIVELERMTDHVLLLTHRSVARILLAYFMGLTRDKVTDLDVPLGMLYCLEPKPYGVDFKAFKYDPTADWFEHQPDYELRKATSHAD